MSREGYVCCDNPACSNAVSETEEAVNGWWSACFSRVGDEAEQFPDGDMPQVDACSQACLGAAVAAATYEPEDTTP